MITRRNAIWGTGAALAAGSTGNIFSAYAQSPDQQAAENFDTLLSRALANESELDEGRSLREGWAFLSDKAVSKGQPPRNGHTDRKISERSIQMLIGYEVTSKAHYTKALQSPIWPKGQSGITIGIGYDIGYITRASYLSDDWKDYIPSAFIERLSKACGVKAAAAAALKNGFSDITIPWEAAESQFRNVMLPFWIYETVSNLPNTDLLSDDSLGALVSLVMNRGAAFRSKGESRQEMRAILEHMRTKQFKQIPDELISMRRIWIDKPEVRGVAFRREVEAALFREGLG